MSGIKQGAALVGVALAISAALYFTMFKSQREATHWRNEPGRQVRENAYGAADGRSWPSTSPASSNSLRSSARSFRMRKEVPGFMKMMNAEAARAGVETAALHRQAVGIQGFLH